jgi:hypothetical protein
LGCARFELVLIGKARAKLGHNLERHAHRGGDANDPDAFWRRPHDKRLKVATRMMRARP